MERTAPEVIGKFKEIKARRVIKRSAIIGKIKANRVIKRPEIIL